MYNSVMCCCVTHSLQTYYLSL